MKLKTYHFSVVLVLIVGLFACKKQVEEILPDTQPNYYARNAFSSTTCENGLLTFDSFEHFNSTIDELVDQDKRFEDEILEEDVYADPVLEAFESQFAGFQSLRKQLIDLEKEQVENGTFDFENDPEDHFIEDDFLRVLLNDKLEFIVDNSIYKIINENHMVEIPNTDFSVLSSINESPDSYLHNPNIKIHNLESSPKENISYTRDNGSNTVAFSCPKIKDGDVCHWDFGDGLTSTEKEPIHSFLEGGEKQVTVKVINTDNLFSEGTSSINLASDCDLSVEEVNRSGYNVVFIIDDFESDASYWFLVDGAYISILGYADFNFNFSVPGTYELKVVKQKGNCTVDTDITVYFASECCKKTNSIKNTFAYGGSRKSKLRFWHKSWGALLYHRMGAKIIHKKSNGWRTKADYLSVYGSGTLYFQGEDGEECYVQLDDVLGPDEEKEDRKKVRDSHGFGQRFWSKPSSVYCNFLMEDNGASGSKILYLNTCVE
jgi:hypothetical protein